MTVKAIFRIDMVHPAPVQHPKLGGVARPDESGDIGRCTREYEREGVRIRIIPEVEEHVDVFEADGHEASQSYYELVGLRAEVEREGEGGKLTGEMYRALREPTVEVLTATLRHMREVTGRWNIDVRPTIYLALYVDSKGQIYRRPFSFWITTETGILMDGLDIQPLTVGSWREVTGRVEKGARTSLAHDWLFEARSSLDAGDFNSALIAAAVAGEISMNDWLSTELSASTGLSSSQRAGLKRDLSNRVVPLLLVHLGVIDPDLAEEVVKTFRIRNEVLHGKRRRPLAFADVWSAINAIRSLMSILSQKRPGKE
jgi:hypothetical protein